MEAAPDFSGDNIRDYGFGHRDCATRYRFIVR
jgi:hypothetical protein